MAARRVVVVDPDPTVVRLTQEALRLPEFEVVSFATPAEASGRIVDIDPALIVCGAPDDLAGAESLFRSVRTRPELARVPWLQLFRGGTLDEVVDGLDAGIDDFLVKPLGRALLAGKVRALLRLVERAAASLPVRETAPADGTRPPGTPPPGTPPPPSAPAASSSTAAAVTPSGNVVEGRLGVTGVVPLLRFCEDHRLSGRLTVESAGRTASVEFHGGELMHPDGREASDALDALLELREGSYRIEQQPLDLRHLSALESAGGTAAAGEERPPAPVEAHPAPPPLPAGRLSKVEARGEEFQIQTEVANRPNFTITTIVSRSGKVVRKVETGWPHALDRADDVASARSQMEAQHERVAAKIREVASRETPVPARSEGPAPVPHEATVDAALLAWAMYFLVEQVWTHVGTTVTGSLLHRSHQRLLPSRPLLGRFRITEEAQVAPDGTSPVLPAEAVAAVGDWAADFLAEAERVSWEISNLNIHQATRIMEPALQKVGFYTAFEAARARLIQDA
jgi:CheY-like chemotaxis protein